MMKKIVFSFLICCNAIVLIAQQKIGGVFELNYSYKATDLVWDKLIMETSGLGGFVSERDTSSISGAFSYKKDLAEPTNMTLTLIGKEKKRMSVRFRAFPGVYELTIQNQTKLVVRPLDEAVYAKQFMELDARVRTARFRLDSALTKISYAGKTVADVEIKVQYMRDSTENWIDEEVYRKYFYSNLENVIGLHALICYAERPIAHRRWETSPDKIDAMFNQLSSEIRNLPSAKLFQKKINQAYTLLPGNILPDVALQDTVQNVVKLRDYKKNTFWLNFGQVGAVHADRKIRH